MKLAMTDLRSIQRFATLAIGLVALHSGECAGQFDNGNPMFSDIFGDLLSDDIAPLWVADNFSLPATAPQISRFMWFGWHGPVAGTPPVRKFHIEIYQSGPVGPVGAPIYEWHDITPIRSFIMSGGAPKLTFGSWPIFRYQYNVPPVALDPDIEYWISIYASTAGTDSSTPWWSWSKSSHTGNNFMFVPGYTPYFIPVVVYLPPHSGEMSFKLFP